MKKPVYILPVAIISGLMLGNFAYADTLNLSSYEVSLNMGSTASVFIQSSVSNNFYLAGNSNSSVVSAGISGSTLTVYGINPGSSRVSICTLNNFACTNLSATVYNSGGYPGPGSLSLSQTNVSLNSGASTTVYAYQNYGNLTVSSSNTNIVTVSASGNQIYIYAQASGTATVAVANSYQSANIYVTVNYNYYSNLRFINSSSLPQASQGSYYTYNLQVTGGTPPYGFTLGASMLPPGLTLSSSGQIYGTPTNSGSYTFTVNVYDNFGHSASSSTLYLNVSSGYYNPPYYPPPYYPYYQTYGNGALVNDNGTVYIIYKNWKSAFASMGAFTGLGYELADTVIGSTASYTNTNYTINSSVIAHPWGSWISVGSTVYFVSDLGLIPVPSYDIFISNGGASKFVVPANLNDFGKPMLANMTYADSRLR